MPIECSQIIKGCDAIFRLTLVDEDNNPLSLTGNRVYFAIRRSFQGCNPRLVEKDSNDGPGEIEILVSPNDNQALIKVLPVDTALLEEGTYWYSVKVYFAVDFLTYVVAQGTIDIISSAFDNP